MAEKHMSVAEFKRHLSDVVNDVTHTKQRVIVERRGRPVLLVGPIEDADTRTPGERLAEKAGFAGEVSEEFEGIMKEVLEARRDRAPRPAPEFES